jgi:hypothetical protein
MTEKKRGAKKEYNFLSIPAFSSLQGGRSPPSRMQREANTSFPGPHRAYSMRAFFFRNFAAAAPARRC